MNTESKLLQTGMLCGLTLVLVTLALGQVTAAENATSSDSSFSDANWSSMGGFPGANGPVLAAVVDGAGNLYIGGDFTIVGDVFANGIAKWDGTNWSALGTGQFASISALVVIGSDLYAAGYLTTVSGNAAYDIAKWDGSNWSALRSGMGGPPPDPLGGPLYVSVSALAVSESDLYAGGKFTTAGGVAATNIAEWNGSSWSALGPGLRLSVRTVVRCSKSYRTISPGLAEELAGRFGINPNSTHEKQ